MESPEGSACDVEGRCALCGSDAVRDGSAVRMGGGDEWLEYEGAQGFGRRGGAGQQQRQLKEAQVGRVIREEIIYPFESKNLYEERENGGVERERKYSVVAFFCGQGAEGVACGVLWCLRERFACKITGHLISRDAAARSSSCSPSARRQQTCVRAPAIAP